MIIKSNPDHFLVRKGQFGEFDPIPLYVRKKYNEESDIVAKLPFYAYEFFYKPYQESEDYELLEKFTIAETDDFEERKRIEDEVVQLSLLYLCNQKVKANLTGSTSYFPLDYPSKVKPYAHQKIATTLLILNRQYALFMEQGTGKTKALIDTLNYLFLTENISKVVVFAPVSVIYSTWIEEIKKNQTVPFNVFPAIDGNRKEKRKKILDWVESPKDRLNYLFLSYDFWWRLLPEFRKFPGEDSSQRYANNKLKSFLKKLKSGFRKALFSKKKREKLIYELELLQRQGFGKIGKLISDALLALKVMNTVEVTVADESQKIKNTFSKRTRGIYYLSRVSRRRYILTGTPITRSPEDIYAQMIFLHPHALRSKAIFRSYFIDSESGVEEIYFNKRKEFRKLIDGISFIVKKEEVLSELPPKRFLIRDVLLKEKTTKYYLKLEKDLIAKIEGWRKNKVKEEAIVFATHIWALLNKLNQITSGFIKESPEAEPLVVSNEKLEVIEDILEERGKKKTVIWSVYRFEIDRICRYLTQKGYKAAKIDGDVPINERKEIISDFQNGSLQVIVAHPQTVGAGLNLTAADAAIYTSLDYRFENFSQSMDRIHRIGQEASYVDYFILLSKLNPSVGGAAQRDCLTIDRKIYEKLLLKKEMIDEAISSTKSKEDIINLAVEYVENLTQQKTAQ
ncbi:Type III restriction enzyme, res subunit [Desulfurobacterium pacificum]|uniref:Type III restriction enzyme, res subunit n=1 Tax=Desulfurobacterium pacificum TaxID=240166 RepID=A0ABY1N7I9_9BACT|nr:DEAD/DEAH box helicase [Desulfurobacterium pacificum]SMP02525.1 Type III restriction enzyme, res subunit [Desulfurobacterium pacificum]